MGHCMSLEQRFNSVNFCTLWVFCGLGDGKMFIKAFLIVSQHFNRGKLIKKWFLIKKGGKER